MLLVDLNSRNMTLCSGTLTLTPNGYYIFRKEYVIGSWADAKSDLHLPVPMLLAGEYSAQSSAGHTYLGVRSQDPKLSIMDKGRLGRPVRFVYLPEGTLLESIDSSNYSYASSDAIAGANLLTKPMVLFGEGQSNYLRLWKASWPYGNAQYSFTPECPEEYNGNVMLQLEHRTMPLIRAWESLGLGEHCFVHPTPFTSEEEAEKFGEGYTDVFPHQVGGQWFLAHSHAPASVVETLIVEDIPIVEEPPIIEEVEEKVEFDVPEILVED